MTSTSSPAALTQAPRTPNVLIPRVFASSADYWLHVTSESSVFFEDSRPDAAAGTTVAICLPGIGDTRRQFRLLAPLLHDQLGFRVLLGDLRGFGDSTSFSNEAGVAYSAYSPESVASDVTTLMEKLYAADPTTSFVLLGNSLSAGSMVLSAVKAQQATSSLPIRAVVLCGPILRDSSMDTWFRPLSHLLFCSWYGSWVWASYYKSLFPGKLPEDFDAELEILKAHMKLRKRNIVNVGDFMRAAKVAVAAAVGNLGGFSSLPVLAFYGRKDPDYADVDAELEWFTGAVPHAQHFEEAEGGHYPHLEHPERIVTALQEASAATRQPKQAGEDDGAKRPRGRHSSFDWLLGVCFLVIVVLIWTFASVLVQHIFHNLSLQDPFFLTYVGIVGISLFSVNLPLWDASQVLYPRAQAWARGLPTNGKMSHRELLQRSGAQASYRQIFCISAIISPLWFVANFTYTESLNLTSVSSSTIVSSTSTVLTFLLNVCALKEPFVWLKLGGVILCMAGNISTIFNDKVSGDDGSTDHVFGDLVALFAAFMYGVYNTAIRRLIPDEENVSISLFFGFIGIINMVCLLPFVLDFHYSGVESLSGLSLEILLLIGVRGLFDNVLSNYLWARAVSPTVGYRNEKP